MLKIITIMALVIFLFIFSFGNFDIIKLKQLTGQTTEKVKQLEVPLALDVSVDCVNWFSFSKTTLDDLKLTMSALTKLDPFSFFRASDTNVMILDEDPSNMLFLNLKNKDTAWLIKAGNSIVSIGNNTLEITPIINKLDENNKSAMEIIILKGKNRRLTLYLHENESVNLMGVALGGNAFICNENKEKCKFYYKGSERDQEKSPEKIEAVKNIWGEVDVSHIISDVCDFIMDESNKEKLKRFDVVGSSCSQKFEIEEIKESYDQAIRQCKIALEKIIPNVEHFITTNDTLLLAPKSLPE